MLDTSVATLLDVDKVSQVFSTGSGEARAPVLSDVSMQPEDRRDRRPARPLGLRQVDASAASSPASPVRRRAR